MIAGTVEVPWTGRNLTVQIATTRTRTSGISAFAKEGRRWRASGLAVLAPDSTVDDIKLVKANDWLLGGDAGNLAVINEADGDRPQLSLG